MEIFSCPSSLNLRSYFLAIIIGVLANGTIAMGTSGSNMYDQLRNNSRALISHLWSRVEGFGCCLGSVLFIFGALGGVAGLDDGDIWVFMRFGGGV
ncbi:hypothetical protein JTE90_009710 [Oedothorax gibbosus]|uniref:Uncharacterized protein n=1 Tax=Oedothorax gibbosus TaxID=931172 RepID=A0AAV6V870_9ARAC|nr:hypothetical protein JTE90_009710 [Oedothorax gibbosus]